MDIKNIIIQCTPAVTICVPVTDDKILNDSVVITMEELYNPDYATIDSSKISPETREIISKLKGEETVQGTV